MGKHGWRVPTKPNVQVLACFLPLAQAMPPHWLPPAVFTAALCGFNSESGAGRWRKRCHGQGEGRGCSGHADGSLPPLLHCWGASPCAFCLVVLCSAIPTGMETLCCASRCHHKLSVLWHCTQPPVPALELQGWTKLEERKVLLLERFSSPPLSPPHLYSSPQGGGGSSGYWSWEHFICKCPCVQVQAPDPRRGASIHPCHPAGSGRRAWSTSWCCGWDGDQEALPDPWG